MRLFDDPATDRRFNRMQWRMLFATMIGYTLFYFMRKNFSFAMPGLEQDCGISKSMLGNFLFWGGIVYGLSKFVNGIVGDKVNPKRMLCFGLLACTLINVAFGFAPQIAGTQKTLVWTFGILLVLNQFFQGTGFPPCAKLIAFWVPPKELATKMSVWNTSHSIGGGLVAKVCGVIMGIGVIGSANQGMGMWKWCFWSMAALGFLGLVLMWLWLPGTPKEEGLPDLPGTEVAREKRQECRFPDLRAPLLGDAALLPLLPRDLGARQIRQSLLLRRAGQPDPHQQQSKETKNRHRPETPLPHPHALVRAADHAEAHDHAANLRDEPAANRMRRVPHAHLRGELVRRHPERDELRARREARALEELVHDEQNA